MNTASRVFGIGNSLCRIFIALLLTGAAIASAQNTNGPVLPADASLFPPLNQLPGKAPRQVWNGLAGAWAGAHARWVATATNDVGAVVFLGDSITAGWNTLARDFPNLKVANRGIGGDITGGVLYRLRADVLSLKPAAIILLIGTNDIGNGADPEDVAGNIRLILQAIQENNPNLKVIVCKVMPRSERGQPIFAETIRKANSLVDEFVKGEPNFAMCDTWGIYADENGNPNPADFNQDRLHLNAAGYAVWKTALAPVMAKLHLGDDKAN